MKNQNKMNLRHGWVHGYLGRLQQPGSILKMLSVLIGLLLALTLIGSMQGLLAPLDGGNTQLGYTIASLRNGANLSSVGGLHRFIYTMDHDTSLQRYFDVDLETGVIKLRDGLRTIDQKRNPLQIFPIRVAEVNQQDHSVTGPVPAANLLVHILSCKSYLNLVDAPRKVRDAAKVPSRFADPATSNDIERCMSIRPVTYWRSKLDGVHKWINYESRRHGNSPSLLEAEVHSYIQNINETFGLTESATMTSGKGALRPNPASVNVQRIAILQDKASPSLTIFRFLPADQMERTDNFSEVKQDGSLDGSDSLGMVLHDLQSAFLFLDPLLLLWLHFRFALLLCFGMVLPLFVMILRRDDADYLVVLKPYLTLVFAQIVSMLVAGFLMGDGLALWVGFAYTLIRLLQLGSWLGLASPPSPAFVVALRIRRRLKLRQLLWLLVALWGINAIGLAWHIIKVFLAFNYISPAA